MADLLGGRPWAQAPWELVTADISAVAFRVVMAIQLHRRPDGEAPFPSQKRLAEMCRVSRPTIERAVRELKEVGILKCSPVLRPGGRFPVNSYTISIPSSRPSSVMDGEPPSITGDGTPPSSVMDEVEEEKQKNPLRGTAPQAAAVAESAGPVVAHYVDVYRAAAGGDPPKRMVGMVAKQVKTLLDEGQPPGVVSRAAELLVERRLSPSLLPSLILEARAGPRQAMRYGRGMTTDQILQAGGNNGGSTGIGGLVFALRRIPELDARGEHGRALDGAADGA